MTILVSPDTTASVLAPRPLLRIVTVGHVDHGKSTLIGRLLHETESIPDGKLDMLKAVSLRRGMDFEWSFLLDSLQTERDQGITIDTSQIRLRTATRDVVLIDAPGHVEFLRNMITGASQADAALVIVDVSEGVREQTRRHASLLHLLDVKQVAVVINKMDRIGYDEAQFRGIETEIRDIFTGLGVTPFAVIPVSARDGDGVAQRTANISWYSGATVLESIESFSPALPDREAPFRLPVQAVYKFGDKRIIAGRIETGRIAVGDEIAVHPSGATARIRSIEAWPLAAATSQLRAGYSVGITIDRDLFVARGYLIARVDRPPQRARRLQARVFWLNSEPARVGAPITVRIATAEARGTIANIDNVADAGALTERHDSVLRQNEVAELDIELVKPIAADHHAENRHTGRVVVEIDGRIAGGGLILSFGAPVRAPERATNIVPVQSDVSAAERSARFGHDGAVIWLTGLPGSGKSTLAKALERRIFTAGVAPILLDGDTLRTGLNADLGFSAADRAENVRRIGEIAAHLAASGLVAVVAAVSPSAADRARARQAAADRFFEVFVATPADVCEQRDPKGHYHRARAGEIKGFTGIDNSYEPPPRPDLTIDTDREDPDHATARIVDLLARHGVIVRHGN
jgi:bifunctional enzyme CysN/CysC